ncbi:F420-dependent oxidoreductase, MSMEG_4879 family [Saccharopolyspora antimicrobica]|uniref:F420-dependent oxidoreductase, MSMEG_4879 family n=1 Tax=Saccharopolyspora antimicrobica TaxID=455193 RepID=A0A1I5K1I8_9PSEU|nr:TIGR03564 family F420-dependent LLM class oxidoreductase [Saccharopolyspora antimicrobica]RKT84746.1 F420-dependent oxidoreductase-like protein [Saccharopolyspora antimicrobica]SFO78868.1 F420-dependent oxidoreductase, MSMEG_4879 family [Saccharopolyspora antimicrobica]
MRIGLCIEERGRTWSELLSDARTAAADGFGAIWLGQRDSWDALTALAVLGAEVPGIRLGTAIVPTYPRHPLALAAQALTVQGVTGGRLDLGIGPSHRVIVEEQFGYSFDKPARHVREYLTALRPLLRGDSVDHRGAALRATGRVDVPAAPPGLLVSALGPVMLRIAGELADGTITLWAGPRALDEHIVPTISAVAEQPRVVAVVSVCVTSEVDDARVRFAEELSVAGELPAYRAMLDRQGLAGPEDVAVLGDEVAVERSLRRFVEAGATELVAVPFGTAAEQERTREVLAALNSR